MHMKSLIKYTYWQQQNKLYLLRYIIYYYRKNKN